MIDRNKAGQLVDEISKQVALLATLVRAQVGMGNIDEVAFAQDMAALITVVSRLKEKCNLLKNFQNPTGYWSHTGSFSVELVPGAPKEIIPKAAEVEGNVVYVGNGSIKQSTGAIDFHLDGKDFHWRYRDIKAIRDLGGNLLWVNRDYV